MLSPSRTAKSPGCCATIDLRLPDVLYLRTKIVRLLPVFYQAITPVFVLTSRTLSSQMPCSASTQSWADAHASAKTTTLNPTTIFGGNLAVLLAVLQQGLASPEHASFVERLRDG
jgi:hypothetical protein